MNTFNRIVMIVLLILAIPVLLLVMIAAIFPGPAIAAVQTQLAVLEMLTLTGKVIVIAAGAVLIVLCLVLLWLELRRPGPGVVKLSKVEGGEAVLTLNSIEQRLAYNVDQLPDVIKVVPKIVGKGKTVDVVLNLETSADVDVPAKTEEIVQVTREVVEERMGLVLGKVKVNITMAPPPRLPSERQG
jgi:hypothetical protein